MRFEVIGTDAATGDARTLVTDVADPAEARARAESYGITVNSVRLAGDDAAAALAVAADADPPAHHPAPVAAAGGGGGVKAVMSFIGGLLIFGVYLLRFAQSCDRQPTSLEVDPGTYQYIQEKMHPKMPAWAEDASRHAADARAEIDQIRAAQAATQPAGAARSGTEEWVKKDGVWQRVK